MTVKVLIVDDSLFFRRRLTEILDADKHIEVVGSASNGDEAVKKAIELKPDVITMDIEMPVMNGIAATKMIMAETPTPILMFSSLTTEGAKATLDALDAGALDFLPKQFDDISSDRDTVKRLLCARVRVLGARGLKKQLVATASSAAENRKAALPERTTVKQAASEPAKLDLNKFKLIAIGTSTGGPVALQKILTALPSEFPLPVVIIQHMPASFTPSFAERLNSLCNVRVKQVDDGDEIKPGTAYIAPGGVQMVVRNSGGREILKIEEAQRGQTYKPSIDITFASLAKGCHTDVLAMVLTGMGADGREGARQLKSGGATIWAQDEASCVVYGMPMAIVEAGLADAVVSLDEIAAVLGKRG